MGKRINYDDYVGQTIGKRTVLGVGQVGRYKIAFCRCECGNDDKVILYSLLNGKADSCLACCEKNSKSRS